MEEYRVSALPRLQSPGQAISCRTSTAHRAIGMISPMQNAFKFRLSTQDTYDLPNVIHPCSHVGLRRSGIFLWYDVQSECWNRQVTVDEAGPAFDGAQQQ